MQEHPIPQDITGYRFHIIGSMTLKQFGELFAGVIIAVIFYNTNLFLPIKWFFILLSVGIGAAAAFLPIEERPLDHWIVTFFKVLYKPTQFFWKKSQNVPESLLYEPSNIAEKDQQPEIDVGPIRRDRIKEYLRSVNTNFQNEVDVEEQTRIQSILKTFQTQPATAQSTKKKMAQKPDLSVRVRKMRDDQTTILPPKEVTVYKSNSSGIDVPLEADGKARDFSGTKKTVLSTNQVAQQIQIPATEIVDPQIDESVEEDGQLANQTNNPEERAYAAQNKPSATESTAAEPASFNSELPFPTVPDVPNKLVGMVISKTGDILPDVIIEIHDEDSIVRAVKTNALGQFFITTPLDSGEYILRAEKDGFTFEDQKLRLKNQVVPPVEVRSL